MKIVGFGILLGGILLVRKAAWRYVSRRTQYKIWLFAAAFLLLSPFFDISSKYSLENIVYSVACKMKQSMIQADSANRNAVTGGSLENMPVTTRPADYSQEISIDSAVYEEMKVPEQTDPADSEAKDFIKLPLSEQYYIVQRGLQYLKMSVSAFMLLMIIIVNVRFLRYCKKNRVFYQKSEKDGLNIYILEGISSPFLFGKNIYVSPDIIKYEIYMRNIIIHESCHFLHKDNLWAVVRNLCLVLNWYNPFVWLANDYVKRDCELACDEAALAILDEKEKTGYGYTLLALLKGSDKRKQYATIVTAMSGDMKKMKERICMIHSENKNYILVTWFMIISMFAFSACTFTGRDSLQADVNTEVYPEEKNNGVEEVNAALKVPAEDDVSEKADRRDTYYNVSAIRYGSKVYVTSSNGLYALTDGSDKWELVHSGPVSIGMIAEGYLFFYTYPEDISAAAIMSLELSSGNVSVASLLGEKIYGYREMCYGDGSLYIDTSDKNRMAVFEIQQGGILKEKEGLQISIPDDLENEQNSIYVISPCISSREGYSGIFYSGKDDNEKYYSKLYYYTDDMKMYQLEGLTDVMITAKGIIGRDVDSYRDVYLWNMDTGEKKLLYSAKDNGGLYFGYNTYDEQGLYGIIKEQDNIYDIARINWDGSLEKIFQMENVSDEHYGVHIQMSVIDDWIYYYNPHSGKMERRNLKRPQTAETEI